MRTACEFAMHFTKSNNTVMILTSPPDSRFSEVLELRAFVQ